MKCEKIEKLLLTDHADGELSPELKDEVARHLENCENCRAVEKKIRSAAIMPFSNVSRPVPPESVWLNIKAAVEPRRTENPVETFLSKLRSALTTKKPVFALATAMVLVVALVSVKAYHDRQERIVSYFIDDQIAFLDSLGNGNGTQAEDIGIPMEDMFM
jgi:anti-sigma factor RsiW